MSKNLRFTLLGLFAMLLTFGFTVKAQSQDCNPQLLTYSVWLEGIEYTAPVDQDAKTVAFTVPYGTTEYLGGTLELIGHFTLSEGAWMTHSEDPVEPQDSAVTVNDFTDPVAFTVHMDIEDCTVEYFVTITEAPNGCNNIGSIQLESSFWGCYEDEYDVDLMFVEGEENAWSVEVPFGTDLTDVMLTFTDADDCEGDWTIEPATFTFDDGVALPVTVTAPNGISEKDYTLTVNVADASTEHLLLTFGLELDEETTIWGVVDENTHRVDVVLPYGTEVTNLPVCFTVSDYACFYINGPEETDYELVDHCVTEVDFTDPRHFTVVAQDGESEDTYNVVVTFEDPDTDSSWSNLSIEGLEDCNGYDMDFHMEGPDEEWVYTLRLRTGLDEGTEFTIDFDIPELAEVDKVLPYTTTFVDGVPVTFTVTAQDESFTTYTLMPEYVTPSSTKVITEFGFDPLDGMTGNAQFNQTYLGTIDQDAKTITVLVPFGTEVDALKASFILDDEFARLTHSEENNDLQVPQWSGMSAIDYTTPVAFTVFAEDCSTVEYFVTVVEDENKGNDIVELTLDGMQYSACECDEGVAIEGDVSMEGTDVTVTVPYGTELSTVEWNVTLEEGATSEPAFPVTGYTEPVDVVVTAADGIAEKTYTITLVVDEPLDENMLLTFGFLQDNNEAMDDDEIWAAIDEVKNRIDVEVPFGTPVEALIPTFTQSPFACVYLNGEQWTAADEVCSDETAVDFSTYQTFTVVAQNGDEAYYNIYVEVLPPDTDNWIHDFVVSGLPECFGDLTLNAEIVMDGMEIHVMVKEGTDVTELDVDFDVPEKATVDPMPGVWDLTEPVEVTVTAQSGDEAVYTVMAVEFEPSSDKMITSYSIGSSVGTINQTTKVIEVWVPWLTDVSSLVATFTLSDGARMTHSEDKPYLQHSGVTANNFTTPVAYTVWAEDCTTLEYFVIVRITPNTTTSISSFVIDVDGCMCDPDGSHFRIDDYARRIYVQIPYADAEGQLNSLSALNVLSIGVADGATVSPGPGTQNFSNGPVTYTVTAPDGVTKVAWEVFVENPPCDDTDIYDWNFLGDVQVGDADIDAAAHTINVTLLPGTDLTSMLANSDLGCGATICCAAGNCAGNEIDFSGDDNCHTCVVTAQDESITQDWTICVEMADVTKPVAWTNSVLAMNCSDSVMVWGDEAGTIYIVGESAANSINALVNGWTGSISDLDDMEEWLAMNEEARDLIEEAMDNHWAASAGYPDADSTVAIMTDGLYSGLYYAFVVDAAGNVSCASEEAVFIDQCVVEVANLCDLRAGSPVYTYVVTGEVLVSYEESDFKFIQDDGCGIKVIDEKGSWPSTLGVGQGLTNIKGTIDKTGAEYKFIPVCCYMPEKSSSGNTIEPVMLTFDEFIANCYNHERGYESMLVRVTDPMIAFDDYSSANPNWVLDFLDLATVTAKGDYEWIIQKVFDANYIGDAIPTDPTIYQGIRTNVFWGTNIYGLITPRSKTDIIKVTAGDLIADPNPASVSGVQAGDCGPVTISIINQGVGSLTISALYLDDAVGTDEFELIDPVQVPFTLGTWESQDVLVHFCPNNAGDESTSLLVEYGDGMVMEVPINGETAIINPIPYCEDFEPAWPRYEEQNGWAGTGECINYGNVGSAFRGTRAYVINGQEQLVSPAINLTVDEPVVTWYEGTIFGGNSVNQVWVSTDKSDWSNAVKVAEYKLNTLPEVYSADNDFAARTIDLADFAGQTIYVKWKKAGGNYWTIDDICFIERITKPILTVEPMPGDFGGVQVNETGTLTFTVKNTGVSILNIKSVELIAGSEFALTDDNSYPVEIYNVEYAWATDGGVDHVSFDVSFSPTDIGIYTGKVLITYGLFDEKVVEVPFSGEGLSCFTAAEAHVGENWAASQNSWFTYTAEKFQIVYINSCHPFNTTDPYEYSFDTWLWVFADCAGDLTKDAANPNVVAQNDDLEWDACPYNRASSGVTFAMNEGETVKIFWPWEFDSANDDIGFYFNIEPSYPIDGDVCETAIPLTLPVVNHFGTTVGFEDDYDASPCSPFSNYMDGNDKVYSITLDVEGYLTANILGAYGSVHVLDECPVEELEKRNCKLFASGPNGGEQTKRIQPGFYYVIVSTWSPPQTVDYLLNMSFEELSTGVDDENIMSSLKVYPNPTTGMFTVSISSAEASDLTLELVNISGQTVYRNEVKSVYSYNEEIDASAFAKGVYYLKVNDGEEVKIEKIIIQ